MDAETRRRIKDAVVEVLKGADMAETTEFKVRSMAAEKLGMDLSLPDRRRFVRGVVESFLLSSQKDQSGGAGQDDDGDDDDDDDEGAGPAAAGGSGKESRTTTREEEEEEDGDEDRGGGGREREYDDEGNLVVCHLSNRRRVTIQDFRGKTLVSIREFYEKDGKQLPSNKGISLTADQWVAFRDAVPSIENAIKKLQSRLN